MRNLGNILCLGDSITECRDEAGTWRYPLWKKLVEAGYTFDFIGTQGRQECSRSDTPEYLGRRFDADNEGHGGWTSEDILRGKDDEPEERLEEWLKEYTPETVLLHLGGNDVREARNKPWAILGLVQQVHRNFREIIGLLQADNPEVTIYLALHIKANGDDIAFANGALDLLNSGLPKIAEDCSTETSRVIVVDHNTGWNNDLLLDDGIHPNAAGNERMAEVWFKTIHEGPQPIQQGPPVLGCLPQKGSGMGDLLVLMGGLAVLAASR